MKSVGGPHAARGLDSTSTVLQDLLVYCVERPIHITLNNFVSYKLWDVRF